MAGQARALASSEMTEPFLRRMTLWQRPASSLLWVTRTSVVPRSRLSPKMSSTIESDVSPSRFPVGSSQKRIFGAVDEGPGEGDPLLLSAGKLHRVMAGAVGEADALEERPALRGAAALAAKLKGDQHVLEGRQGGYQLEVLEDKADAGIPDLRALVLVQGVEAAPRELDRPPCGTVETRRRGRGASSCRFRWAR